MDQTTLRTDQAAANMLAYLYRCQFSFPESVEALTLALFTLQSKAPKEAKPSDSNH